MDAKRSVKVEASWLEDHMRWMWCKDRECVWVFVCSSVQVFKCSGVQVFRCSGCADVRTCRRVYLLGSKFGGDWGSWFNSFRIKPSTLLMTLSWGGWALCEWLGRRGTCGFMVLFIIIKKVINNVDDFKSGRLDSLPECFGRRGTCGLLVHFFL